MERLTTNKDVSDIEGMYELAHNSCYIDKDGNARYRDFETDVDARILTRELLKKYTDGDDAFISDDDFDNQMMEALQYGTDTREGLIALFYRNLWAMAELRERLKAYEDLQDMIGVPFEKFAELCKQEIPEECKNPSKAIILTDNDVDEWHQYKADKEQGLLVKLPCKVGDWLYYPCSHYNVVVPVRLNNVSISFLGLENYSHQYNCCSFDGCGDIYEDYEFDNDDIGKTVFLTQAEAEQALEKTKEV